jgi:hypothetical protein|tara:strand:- start:2500 stop:3315 length:816 start_codon:yes stop_codon:yes gene_type:complete
MSSKPVFLSFILSLCISLSASLSALADEPVSVAVIIDDLGINLERGKRAIQLPGRVTYALLPYAKHSITLANEANAKGKEIILHMPMENVLDKPIDAGGLTHSLNKEEFQLTLNRAIDRIPHISGINNHMGSYLTQRSKQMGWLMDELKGRELFFVDSRTTPKTLAATIARQKRIPETSRDVFLDNTKTFHEIDLEFKRLLKLARANGSAIAIGHPFDTTLSYLEQALPKLESQNIQLLPASSILALQELKRARDLLVHTSVDEFGSLGSD